MWPCDVGGSRGGVAGSTGLGSEGGSAGGGH
jgi:hypothetical protein